MQLARAALICGYTAKDAPRQMSDPDLANYFGISTNIIGASPEAFYRRWVIQTTRQALPSSPETCRAILDNPSNAPALAATMLASRNSNAPAATSEAADSNPPPPAEPGAAGNGPADAQGTAPRVQEISDTVAQILRQPQGAASQEDINNALADIHALLKTGGLSFTESNNLHSLSLALLTRATTEGFMSPEQMTGNPEFVHSAIGSMAFGGAANSSMRMPGSPAGPVLPRTNSTFVPIGSNNASALVRIGRWMHPDELEKMQQTGTVQENSSSQTRAAYPASPGAYRNSPKGDVYVEFDVPANRVTPHSNGTVRIPGPKSREAKLAAKRGEDASRFEMPPATNIKVH